MTSLNLKISDKLKHIEKPLVQKFTPEEKNKLAKATKDFETLMTSMMLKSMTDSTEGMFGKEGFGADMMDSIFQQELAGHMTQSRSLGIAQLLYKNITGEDLTSELLEMRLKKTNDYSFSTNNFGNKKVDKPISGKPFERLKQYENIIQSASQKYNVDTNIIKSIILTESAANEKAVSSANAKGLMQLMDGTAKDLGVKNSFDPVQNIYGGTKYISQMLRQYNGDLKLALAAYNAGPGNVNKYNGVPPFTETKNYIERVMNYLNKME